MTVGETNLVKQIGRKRICFVTAVPVTINVFLRPHIRILAEQYDVLLATNGSAESLAAINDSRVTFAPIPIRRKISIGNDLLALVKLWRLFGASKLQSVHSITPKAGLLSMTAAKLAGVDIRVHTFTGQVWANKKGVRRWCLKYLDRFTAHNATHVLADSHSQRNFLLENQIVKPAKIVVLGSGSIAGVSLKRFGFDPVARKAIRASLGIPSDAIVFIFLGRLNRDKGVVDLARAFKDVAPHNPRVHLMVVGTDDDNLEGEFAALSRQFPGRVHRIEFTECPERYLSSADVICLPSYREGFGSVLIEAAAVGLPAIASRIYGITDAVEDGVTGILHRPASNREISEAMLNLAHDSQLRNRMGNAAHKRVAESFSEERLTAAMRDFYQQIFTDIARPSRS